MAVEGGCSALSLWELLIEPGSSTRLVPLINVSLVLLLVALLVVYYYFQSVHIVIMGALAIGLLASVNWWVVTYRDMVFMKYMCDWGWLWVRSKGYG